MTIAVSAAGADGLSQAGICRYHKGQLQHCPFLLTGNRFFSCLGGEFLALVTGFCSCSGDQMVDNV